MNTIVVTGGAGFIGSHLTEAYLRDGWRVVVVDDFSCGTKENLAAVWDSPHLVVERVDIRDGAALTDVFRKYRPTAVNHHAAQKSVADSMARPLLDQDINGKGFLQVLTAAMDVGVKQIVYASSGGALSKVIEGDELSHEDDPPQLISPYAVHKFAGEKYLAMYAAQGGYQYTVLRYANVYGPRQVADGECGVVPIFVDNILAGRPSTLMTYPDMPRGCSRDYVYVGDVVRANLMATAHPLNTVVNIGSGRETYILDIYEMLAALFDSEQPIHRVGPRPGDIRRSVLCADRAQRLLGWTPEVDWQEGLQRLQASIRRQ